jgi:hypothetical protein
MPNDSTGRAPTATKLPRGRRSRRRRLALSLLLLAFVFGACELLSFGALCVLHGKVCAYAAMRTERNTVIDELRAQIAAPGKAQDADKAQIFREVTVHPYVGYSVNTDTGSSDTYSILPQIVKLSKRAPDRFNVAVVGGSVAAGLLTVAPGYLREQLAALPALRGKNVNLQVLALGGFKQPQQVMSLAYSMALGCEFDCVINVDGYNEVVLGRVENLPFGIHSIYPRSWRLLTEGVTDVQKQIAIGKAAVARLARLQWGEAFSGGATGWSLTLQLLWLARDRSLHNNVDAALTELFDIEKRHREHIPCVQSGPPSDEFDDRNVTRFLADVWRRSSLQLQAICAGSGIAYVHILQPNQYVPGSKPLTAEERRDAYWPEGSPTRVASEEGYALLVEEGKKLREAGVDFHDLTRLFEHVNETLYVDLCCHFNALGNRLLIEHIAAVVQQHLGSGSRPTRIVPVAAEAVIEGSHAQLCVEAHYADGSVRQASDHRAGTTWTSADPAVVAVDADGVAYARSFGTTTVVARNGDASCSILVRAASVVEYGDSSCGPRLAVTGPPQLGNRGFALQFLGPEGDAARADQGLVILMLQMGYLGRRRPLVLHEASLVLPMQSCAADPQLLATVPLPLPADPALLGALVNCQGGVLSTRPDGIRQPTNSVALRCH